MAISIKILFATFGLMAVVGLTACANIPITSMYKLRNFNPTTTDIHRLRFAVRIPDDIGIPEDGVQLMLGTEHSERTNLQESFSLEATKDLIALRDIGSKGLQVHTFQIANQDIIRFKRLQQTIRVEKAHGADGILEVKADVCRTKPELPLQIPISTFVNASETRGYVAMLLNADVLSRADRKTRLELAPECTP